jgi:hypothetical protein
MGAIRFGELALLRFGLAMAALHSWVVKRWESLCPTSSPLVCGSESYYIWCSWPLDPVATYFLASMRVLAAAITATASVQYAFAWGAAGTRPTPSKSSLVDASHPKVMK